MSEEARRGGLSRRLTRYGDDRFARFLRDAFLQAKGLTEEAPRRLRPRYCYGYV